MLKGRRLRRFLSALVVVTMLTTLGVFGTVGSSNTVYAISAPTYVSAFESIGLYWNPGVANQGSLTNTVQYRVAGFNGAWNNGLSLWYDSRSVTDGIHDRPAEFRGSIVGLIPGTSYEVKLTLSDGTTSTITATTMSEYFPVGSIVYLPASSTSQVLITAGGTASAYKLYTFDPANGSATINANNAVDTCITVTAPYVIIRGITCTGAKIHGIDLQNGAHHVVIENSDISNWGTERSAGTGLGVDFNSAIHGQYLQPSVKDIVIQRNKIHNPRYTSNSWDTGHPSGPNGIAFEQNGGGHNIFRYNEIIGDASHYYNDNISGGENYSLDGMPGPDSDIYGNLLTHSHDDSIEAEGGGRNVRVWGNYIDKSATGVSSVVTSVGPLYIFRNVENTSRKLYNVGTDSDTDRGPFGKSGNDRSNAAIGGGERYFFHNTTLQVPPPAGTTYPLGAGAGINDDGGPLTNTVSRNNIWHIWKSNWSSIVDSASPPSTTNDFNYDLYNGNITAYAGAEANGIHNTPVYAANNGWVSGSGGLYALDSTSPGYHAGIAINNFNSGLNVDMGAHQSGTSAMQFGVSAYNANRAPLVYAGANNSVSTTANLAGTAYDDGLGSPNGTLTTTWSKVSGPGTVTFGNAAALATTAAFSAGGTYVLRLMANDGSLQSTSDVTITSNAASGASRVTSGLISYYAFNERSGTIVRDQSGFGTPLDMTMSGSVSWLTARNGINYTASPGSLNSAGAAGKLQTEIAASGGWTVEVNVKPANITQNGPARLVAYTLDSPNQNLQIGQDGTTFVVRLKTSANTTSVYYGFPNVINDTSEATFVATYDGTIIRVFKNGTQVGTQNVTGNMTTWDASYPLKFGNEVTNDRQWLGEMYRVAIYNRAITASEVSQNYNAANAAPTVNAGPNQNIGTANSANLSGTAFDDGLPNNTTFTTTWSKVSGPGTVTFGNASALATTAAFSAGGTYVLRLTANDGSLQSTSDVTITKSSSVTNKAVGITPTSSITPFVNPTFMTDGNTTSGNYAEIQQGGPQWVQIDLGTSGAINQINLWHYYGDARTYHDVIVQISDSSTFTASTTVFNNDTDNSALQGTGTDAEYTETSTGKIITFAPVTGRYVRFWTNGYTLTGGATGGWGHYTEAEVWSS